MTEAPPRSNLAPDSSKWVQWVEDKVTKLLSQATEVSQTANRGVAATSFVQDQNSVQQGMVNELDSALLDTQSQVDNVETIATDAAGAITVAPTVPYAIDGMGGYILADGTEVPLDAWDDLTLEQQEGATFVPSKPEGAIWDTAVTAETEATYSWTGAVNNSASIESVGGVERRRNFATNPRAASSASGTWGGGHTAGNVYTATWRYPVVSPITGITTGYRRNFTTLTGGYWVLYGSSSIACKPGDRITAGILLHVDADIDVGDAIRANIVTRTADGASQGWGAAGSVDDLGGGWYWLSTTRIAPENAAVCQNSGGIFDPATTPTSLELIGTASIILVGVDGSIPERLDPTDFFDGATPSRMIQTGTDITDTRYIWDGNEWRPYVIGESVLDPEIIGNVNTYVANLAGSIVQVGPTTPASPNKGTLWWETDASGVKFKGLWYYNGTIWQSYTLAANDIIAANSITTPLLKAGALDAFQITSPLIQSVATANRGIKWTGGVITGYTNTGAVGFKLDAGQATINGGSIIGGTITQSSNGTGDNVILSNGAIQFETLTGDLGGALQAGYVTLWDGSEQRTQLWSNALQLSKLGSSDLTTVTRGRFQTRIGASRAALIPTTLVFYITSESTEVERARYGYDGLTIHLSDSDAILRSSTLSLGGAASTVEPSVSFNRKDPSTGGALSAKLYLANITGGVPSIAIYKDGATAGTFRIYESGRISMQTQGASSTANAVRDLPFAVTSGSVYVEALASNTASTFPITFPTNLFTKPPTVVASIRGTSGALRHTVAVMSPTTTTGCTLRAANFTSGTGDSHYIDWIAIQPTV